MDLENLTLSAMLESGIEQILSVRLRNYLQSYHQNGIDNEKHRQLVLIFWDIAINIEAKPIEKVSAMSILALIQGEVDASERLCNFFSRTAHYQGSDRTMRSMKVFAAIGLFYCREISWPETIKRSGISEDNLKKIVAFFDQHRGIASLPTRA